MKSTLSRVILAAAIPACLFLAGSCSEDDPVKPEPAVQFKELTDKENVVYNFAQSYKYCDIGEYAKLLHAEYIWTNQESDVIMHGLDPYWDRTQDSTITGVMFSAKLHSHPDTTRWLDRLNLTIHPGAWAAVADLGGEPCENCWETTRAYVLELHEPYGDMFYIADDLVKLTVIEVQANGRTEYRLLAADDLSGS